MQQTEVRVGYYPAGIKINPESTGNYPHWTEYEGISYCDAMRRATSDNPEALLVGPDSVNTCLWNPQVFGFRPPGDNFDLKVEYSLPQDTRSILIAPLDEYSEEHPPDVVVIRAKPGQLEKIFRALGPSGFNTEMAGSLDRSALEIFTGSPGRNRDRRRVMTVNRLLANLNRFPEWREFTKFVFKYEWTTFLFDMLLDRFLANMSICRNSTVIPYLTGKANISFFCTGAVAWGLNKPGHMTCGIPYPLTEKFLFVVENDRTGH